MSQPQARDWSFGETEYHPAGCQQEIVDPDGETVGWIECCEGDRTNANLVLAAPDLLAALRAVVSVADRKTDEFDLAHAAIAKAEGKQP